MFMKLLLLELVIHHLTMFVIQRIKWTGCIFQLKLNFQWWLVNLKEGKPSYSYVMHNKIWSFLFTAEMGTVSCVRKRSLLPVIFSFRYGGINHQLSSLHLSHLLLRHSLGWRNVKKTKTKKTCHTNSFDFYIIFEWFI